MKKVLAFALLVVLLATSVFVVAPTSASPAADCQSFGFGGIPNLSSLAIDFSCTNDATVYFGVCDSGGVPNDDLFTIVYNDVIVSSNQFIGSQEFVTIGQALLASGIHVAMLKSINDAPALPATYSYAISSDQAEVASYLRSYCGSDFSSGPVFGDCVKSVPVFTMDAAPSNGTLKFDILFGAQSREEGINLRTWDVVAGQQINNDTVLMPAPYWARLWWQPEGEDVWYLLPSQYWVGDGTRASEYGLSCDLSGVPSYHTSFESAIPESEVPLFDPS